MLFTSLSKRTKAIIFEEVYIRNSFLLISSLSKSLKSWILEQKCFFVLFFFVVKVFGFSSIIDQMFMSWTLSCISWILWMNNNVHKEYDVLMALSMLFAKPPPQKIVLQLFLCGRVRREENGGTLAIAVISFTNKCEKTLSSTQQ